MKNYCSFCFHHFDRFFVNFYLIFLHSDNPYLLAFSFVSSFVFSILMSFFSKLLISYTLNELYICGMVASIFLSLRSCKIVSYLSSTKTEGLRKGLSGTVCLILAKSILFLLTFVSPYNYFNLVFPVFDCIFKDNVLEKFVLYDAKRSGDGMYLSYIRE